MRSACQCSRSLLLLFFTSKFRTETTTIFLKSFIIKFTSIHINELEHEPTKIHKFRPSGLIIFFQSSVHSSSSHQPYFAHTAEVFGLYVAFPRSSVILQNPWSLRPRQNGLELFQNWTYLGGFQCFLVLTELAKKWLFSLYFILLVLATPQKAETMKRKGGRNQLHLFSAEQRICGPSSWDPAWTGGKGMRPTHLGRLGRLEGILFRANEKNSLVSHLPWKTNIETGYGFFLI